MNALGTATSVDTGRRAPTIDDRDTLHTVALKDLPIEHPLLKRARMVKNSRLDSVVEVFRDREGGSGQIEVEKLPQELGASLSPKDFSLMRRLALMPSYDVYSLRVTLRDENIAVNDQEALRLSPAKTKELASFMKSFTRPLLAQVYGDDGIKIETFDQVIGLFRDPDPAKARHKLTVMAGKLGIEISEIPDFLEDYADIFLSLSYYKQCLDFVTPGIHDLFDSFVDLRKSLQMRNNAQLMNACTEIQDAFTDMLTSVTGRIESFDRNTKDMWSELSAERFRKIEAVIRTFHTTMGGILCALTVKMDSWAAQFPNRRAGAPGRRADFILNDMRHGMKRIRALEKQATPIAA
jgi:hypothetical protein